MNRAIAPLFALAVAGVAGVAAQHASASVVSIWANDGVSGWQLIASGPTVASFSSYTTINGAFSLHSANAALTNGPSAELASSSFEVIHNSAGTDSLMVAITGTGYTSPTLAPISVFSAVSGINPDHVLTGLTFQSFIDISNNGNPSFLAGGQGVQVPAVLFPTISGSGSSQTTTIATNLASPYSVSHLAAFTMSGIGHIVSFGGDTTLNVPAPAAATLLGLGGLMATRRRRARG